MKLNLKLIIFYMLLSFLLKILFAVLYYTKPPPLFFNLRTQFQEIEKLTCLIALIGPIDAMFETHI